MLVESFGKGRSGVRKRASVILALLCGLVCAASVLVYTNRVEANAAAERTEALARYGGDQVEVCVALRDVAAGETIDQSSVSTRLWLVDLLPRDPITTVAEVVGKQATSSIVEGEVLCRARFEETGGSVSVPQGLQAVGVELAAAQAVGGALKAGEVVDVYAAGPSGTSLIAGSVLVAAVSEGQSGRLGITLAVDPEHVEEIIASTQSATLYLTLPSKQEGT